MVNNSSTQQLERDLAKLWMVLVGVNHYQDGQIPNLRYCANDCKELAEVLKIATQQFQEAEIIPLYDGGEKSPELSAIVSSIQQFRLAQPEDTVLFYFSGHGYLDSNNRPILCVADTSLSDLAATGLKLDILLNELRQCKAKRQLVWLDACQEQEQQQDNSIRQNPAGQLLAVLEQQAEQSQDFYAMLSCNQTERSWEIPELKHGLFTHCLIEGLGGKAANAEGKIDADSLFKYVERSSHKFIEYKKNFADDFSKGMGGTVRESSTKLKVDRFPANASQTPQRIARGSGELIIGLSTPPTQRRALIVDNLSASQADISLCKILQSLGSFEVDYCFLRDKHRLNIQQLIASYLQEESNKAVFLYLAGTIESSHLETYDLVWNRDNRINLNWLSQQLRESPVKEVIIIADILDSSGTTKNFIEILQPNQDKSLCSIAATTAVPHSRKFLHQLVTVLETAGKSKREFWVAELITQLQRWCESQADINLKLWLSGSTEVMDILSVEVQRSDNEIFEIELCPYKSLQAFTQDDAYFFHGREELIAEIIDKLQSTSFLAVVGASGSGKSSVVKAGVIPKLLTEGLFNYELEEYKSCQSWVMFPGDNPLAALAKTLAPDNPAFLEGVLHLGVDSLVAWLRQQPQEISVLVIDQFEELFTLTGETDCVNFISLILGGIQKARDCFKVIITLRSDFLDECLGMSELAPLITKSQVLVPSCRLEDKQYRQIIAQPAQKVGLEVEDGLIALLLEELREGNLPLLQYALEELWQKRSRGKLTVKDYQQYIGKLGKFLSNKAQETYNNLSEVQQKCAQSIFLSLVFLVKEEEDSNKDTRRRLPISKLSVNKYKDVLDSTLQALIEARLIVVSGEENNLSLVDREQVNAADDKGNQPINNLVLAASVDDKGNQPINNLVLAASVAEETVRNQSKDKVTVEVAHEILLRDWETLKWWLDENREKYRLIKEINQKADEWTQNEKRDGFLLSKGALVKYEEFYVNYADELSGKSNEFIDVSIRDRDKAERLAKRRQRQIIGGLTGGIVVISMVAGVALWQLRRATISEINALSNSAEAALASNQDLDALVTGLKAAKKVNNIFLCNDYKTKIKILGTLQDVFYKIKEFNRLEGHTNNIRSTKYSFDGQTIATASQDNTVKLWSLQGKLLHTLEGSYSVFSPDGQTIATLTKGKTVKLWNFQGQLLLSLDGYKDDSINRLFFSADGQTIAIVEDKIVKLWSLQGQLISSINVNKDRILFSPNGQTIATVSEDNKVKLWNFQGQLLHSLNSHKDYIDKVLFSADGKTIATASKDKTIKLWNLKGQLLRNLKNPGGYFDNLVFTEKGYFENLALSPDGKNVAFSQDKILKIWNFKGELIQSIKSHTQDIQRIEFSPDGQTIASLSTDETVKLWNLQGELLHSLIIDHSEFPELNYFYHLLFSPDSQIISFANAGNTAKLWNLQGKLLYSPKDLTKINTSIGSSFANSSIVFSPNNKTIAFVGDNFVKFWKSQEQLLYFSQVFRYTAFSTNGKIIAAASSDRTLKLWNIKRQLLHTLEGHTGNIQSIVFSPDNQTIASASSDRTIKLWNIKGQLLHTLEGHTGNIKSIVFSPDNQNIAAASSDNTIKLWNIKGQLPHALEGHTGDIKSIVFSPDSQTIAAASEDKKIKLWNIKGQLLHTLEGHTDSVYSIAFSSDGQTIISFSFDDTVKLWNIKGQLLHTLEGLTGNIKSIVFSPDSQTIAAASKDNTIKLWNIKGQLLHTLEGHTGDIKSIVFSSDSQTIASASSDNTIKLWNTKGQLLHTLEEAHKKWINTIIFSPDGQIIASAGYDEQVKLWNRKGQLLHTIKTNNNANIEKIVFSSDSKSIAFLNNDNGNDTIVLWSLDLDNVMARGCDWARDYLTNNPNISAEDRKICDGIGSK